MKKVLICLICAAVLAGHAVAGEIVHTGRANINKDDVRTAYDTSLKNALFGGIRRYIQEHAPDRKADITEDYFMFVDEYEILDRKLSGNRVDTTVRIKINDLITEDIAVYATIQVNTAVFLVSGLPDYVNEARAREVISGMFAGKQFSTREQIPFEQELIDRRNRYDIQTAFQSVSATQYLFELRFNVTEYKAGESCTVQSDSSYISATNLAQRLPILRTEITIEEEDAEQCILTAVENSVDSALTHLREKVLPAPVQPQELYKYQIVVSGVTGLRTVNNLMDTLIRRKILNNSNMEGFFSNEAIFAVECYLTPQELALQIQKLGFEGISEIAYNDAFVRITVTP